MPGMGSGPMGVGVGPGDPPNPKLAARGGLQGVSILPGNLTGAPGSSGGPDLSALGEMGNEEVFSETSIAGPSTDSVKINKRMNEKSGKKSKQKAKKDPKDPNAPRRAKSAFFWFSKDERSKI
ncbi:non-histone chromosomal protein 6 homolog, partial [Artemia franciscana]|uniref:non-histone chromosomal protein 6 homolog n=1 Tax=Artemia franciscana TaxID=6661 RepID=UPI0032DBD83C